MLLNGNTFFFFLFYNHTAFCALVCGGGGEGGQNLRACLGIRWGAAAKQDHKKGACAFKTQVSLVWLRGAVSALSPDRCTTATFQITPGSCCYISDNKGKKKTKKTKSHFYPFPCLLSGVIVMPILLGMSLPSFRTIHDTAVSILL